MFVAVRGAGLPAIWSDGVKLAREGAVRRDKSAADERSYRVRAGQALDVTVTLYLEDEEWSCTCGGHADPCAHVAAAAIAEKQGLTSEAAAPAALASMAYHFSVREARLHLRRTIRQPDGSETPFVGLLSSAIAAQKSGVASTASKLPDNLSPTQNDLRIDRISEGRADLRVPMHELEPLFDALATHEQIYLDNTLIRVDPTTVQPIAEIKDSDGGFVVRLRAPKDLEAVIARGVGKVQGVLRPLASREIAGDRYENLPLDKRYGARDAATLAQVVLPELEATMADVVITSKRLPERTKTLRPRLDFELTHADGLLFVLPRVVYGDPPVARVEGEQLVSLGNVAPKRRPADEATLVHALRDKLNLVPGRRVDFRGADAARFLSQLRSFHEERGESAQELEAVASLQPVVQIAGEGSFEVWFEGEGKRADADSVISAWRAGLELVPLLGGGFAKLPAGWMDRYGARVAELLAARGAGHRIPRVLSPELGALCTDLELPSPPDLAQVLESFAFAADGALPAPTLPSDLRASLRDYQAHGVAWLQGLTRAALGGILADDMGLGKTVQTLSAIGGRTLVVCPKSVVWNWASECAKFRPSLRVAVHERGLIADADLVLTTYARLRIDADTFAAETWDCVVLDEAQAIKNPASQTTRAAFRLQAKLRLALSGTPVENRLEELWSLLHFATPGLLGDERAFRDRFAEPIANGRDGAAADLRARIRPFVLRRTKREVLRELPPRTEVVDHVQLEESERASYDAVLAATKKEVLAQLGEGHNTLAILEALLRLRQAACHSGLLPGNTASESSKVTRLIEQLEELAAEGHRALVFSQWTSLLDKVEPALEAAGLRFARIDGQTRDRGEVVNAFQAEDGPPVLLLSLKAGGTGLNLTAADHVFLLDPWWNPAVEDQAADRAHRIGQTRPVLVHRLVAKDTVEERILQLQEKKRALADAALGEGNVGAAITREELLALLES